MATINIKLSQETVDQLNRIDTGETTNLSDVFGTVVETNSYISENFSWANSWSSSGNKVSLKFGGVASLTYTGTVYPDYPGSYSGEAIATSRVLNAPNYFKETVSGALYYEYYAPSYLSYTPIGISTINTYKLEYFQSDADLGLTSYSLTGGISLSSSNGEISGTLSNLTVTASKIGTTKINGNLSVSSNSNNPQLSSVTGTLTQYVTTYIDKSFLNVTGALNIQADTVLGESVFAEESNFSDADTISIVLPNQIYSDYIINSGQGNDIISAGGGGGRLFINSGQGDDEITLLDSSPVINGGDGDDTVKSSAISLDLRNYTSIEKITLLGTKALNATGNSDVNVLRGNSAANVLDSQGGADSLEGGAGNDTYVVYGNGETITDTAGTDLVRSYASWTLAAGFENLTLLDGEMIDGFGNVANNTITGNSSDNLLEGDAGNDVLISNAGNDTLDGGIGADKMTGGTGDDVYIVDNIMDVVTEKANEGTDTIETTLTSLSIAKLSAIENLTYTGFGNAILVGNASVNTLTGNSGTDRLDGGIGGDSLIGGDGNDLYIVDDLNDTITENDNEGTDSVQSSVTFTLSNYVENLTLTGKSAINGTGSAQDNIITGNTAANTLNGGLGNDTLDGGAGNDTLSGGDGSDVLIGGAGNDSLTGGDGTDYFVLNAALSTTTNRDTITDFTSGDHIQLENAVFKKLSVTGTLNTANFANGVAVDANDYILYNSSTGVLSYDADGSGKGAAVQIALIGTSTHAALTYADFVVI
jgi:Ca2+-binding RTX toxin-like protein